MENDEHRNEYVMEDSGYIWKGISYRPEKNPWNFGQVKLLYHVRQTYWVAQNAQDLKYPPETLCPRCSSLVDNVITRVAWMLSWERQCV